MYCPYIALKDKGLFLSLLWLPYGEIDEKKDGFWCLELISQSIYSPPWRVQVEGSGFCFKQGIWLGFLAV